MTTRSWILAIDFGTSYTVAAALVEGRSAEVVEIDGNRRVPSVVLAEGDRFVVGKLADELASAYPSRTLRAPKRRIGDTAPVILDGRPHQIVDLVAAVLGHVYDETVRQFGGPPSEVRLTHPAVWVRPQLNRLLEAAARAGITNAVLVPEPVAAALAYATEVGVGPGAHVAVYDLGGGTFDTAVVTPSDTGFRIIGRPGGDPAIGGELFDELLAAHVGDQLDPATWHAIQFSDDPTWRRLDANMRHEVRRAKETLSGYPVAEILVPVPGELVQMRITRDEYESLIEDHLGATVDLLERCARDAGSDPSHLGAVYLVGGASRTPLVTRLVEQRFPGIPISRRGDPKTSTAVGAALAVRSGDLRSADLASRSGAGPLTPPPTPFAGAPVSKPPSVPPPPAVSGPPVSAPPVPAPPVSAPPASVSAPPTQVQPTVTLPVGPAHRRRRTGLWLGLLAVVVAAGAGAALVLSASGDDDATPSTAAAATTLPADTDPSTVTTADSSAATTAAPTTAASTTGPTSSTPTETTVIDGLVTGADVAEFEDFVVAYYSLTNARDYTAAWAYLTARHQDLFGTFKAFTNVFDRIDQIDLVEFSGCTSADAPADCFFVTNVTNLKGGTSQNMLRFTMVHDGIGLRVDDSEVTFLTCVVKNPGEKGCSPA